MLYTSKLQLNFFSITKSVQLLFDEVGYNELGHHWCGKPNVLHSLDKLFTFTSWTRVKVYDNQDLFRQVDRQNAEAEQSDAEVFVEDIQDWV